MIKALNPPPEAPVRKTAMAKSLERTFRRIDRSLRAEPKRLGFLAQSRRERVFLTELKKLIRGAAAGDVEGGGGGEGTLFRAQPGHEGRDFLDPAEAA